MAFYNFPDQTIPESKKNKDWHIEHIKGYLSFSIDSGYTKRKEEILECYYAANAILSPNKEKIVKSMITECYGKNLGPQYVVYPLIESQIEQLIGMYRERPLRRRAIVKDQEAVNRKFDSILDTLTESIIREANKEMEQELGFVPDSPNPEIKIPEEIEDFPDSNYRTKSEETAEAIAHQILVVKKEKEKLYNALYHYFVSGEAYFVLDEKFHHPSLFDCHPLEVFSDSNPNTNIQDDINYFVYDKFMSINDIFNTHKLSKEQKEKIMNYPKSIQGENSTNWIKRANTDSSLIRTVTMYWKSRRKVQFKVVKDEQTGYEEYKIIPDDERIRKKDYQENNIVEDEVEDVRHITMIGPEIVLSYGRLDNQLETLSDPKKRFLPVVALIDKNVSGLNVVRSLAKKLDWLQDFASEILFELRLSLRYLDSNVMVYDLSNIPKQFLKGGSVENALKKVQFYLKRDKMMLINSSDKRANTYASSINLSQSKRINDILTLLSTIEELASRITGVTDSLKGENKSYEKTGVAEMKLAQASSRIENYYGLFDQFTDISVERLCSLAKKIYKDGQLFHYYAGDGLAKFFTIYPDFMLEDVGIYFDDNRREFRKKQMIDQMAQQAFGQTQFPEMLLTLFKVFNTDTSNEAEKQLKKGLKTLSEIQQQNQEQQQQMQQQQIESMSEEQEKERDIKREGFQKDVVVANIYADSDERKAENKELNENLRLAAQTEKEILLRDFDNEEIKEQQAQQAQEAQEPQSPEQTE